MGNCCVPVVVSAMGVLVKFLAARVISAKQLVLGFVELLCGLLILLSSIVWDVVLIRKAASSDNGNGHDARICHFYTVVQ